MKTVLISTLLLAFSFLTYGQGNSSELSQTVLNNDTTLSSDLSEHTKKEPDNYKIKHNHAAISQLQNHLISNIEYSEIMQENSITEILKIKIYLSKDGSIKKSKISKNASPELVSLVNTAIGTFEKVVVSESLYQGDTVFLIPINFSIEH